MYLKIHENNAKQSACFEVDGIHVDECAPLQKEEQKQVVEWQHIAQPAFVFCHFPVDSSSWLHSGVLAASDLGDANIAFVIHNAFFLETGSHQSNVCF